MFFHFHQNVSIVMIHSISQAHHNCAQPPDTTSIVLHIIKRFLVFFFLFSARMTHWSEESQAHQGITKIWSQCSDSNRWLAGSFYCPGLGHANYFTEEKLLRAHNRMRKCATCINGLTKKFAETAVTALLPLIVAMFSLCTEYGTNCDYGSSRNYFHKEKGTDFGWYG